MAVVDDYYNNGSAWTTTWSGPKGTGRIILNGSEPQPSYTVDVAPDKRPVFRGRQTTFNAVIRPANGYAGTLMLSALGLPSGTTAAFNPTHVVVAGQDVSSTLTITTTTSSPLGRHTFEVNAETGDGQDRSMAMATLDLVDFNVVNQVGPGTWETTSAVSRDGSPGGFDWWAQVWKEALGSSETFVSVWNGSWSTKEFFEAIPPNTALPQGDPNLVWDGARKGMFLTALTGTNVNLWFLSQTEARKEAGSWEFCGTVFSQGQESSNAWDYPSVAVASDGRVVVGAARVLAGIDGYYAMVSHPGTSGCPNFTNPAVTAIDLTPGRLGIPRVSGVGVSRVAAAGNTILAFLQETFPGTQSPRYLWKAVLGNGPATELRDLAASTPEATSPIDTANPPNRVGYGPTIAVDGNSSGTWAVVFPEKQPSGTNNMVICSSGLSACQVVSAAPVDQFLAGISVAQDRVWITYFQRVPGVLADAEIRSAVYPIGQGGMLSTPAIATVQTVSGPLRIDLFSWPEWEGGARCALGKCRLMGDYNTISATQSEVSIPFVSAPGVQQQIFWAPPQ